MKALIAAILVVCIVFTGGITYLNLDNRDAVIIEHAQAVAAEQRTQEVPAAMEDVPAAEGEAAEVPEAAEAPMPEYKGLDLEAVYALHQGDEVVMSINGRDVCWDDYYYWLNVQASQVDAYLEQMLMYTGQEIKWSDTVDEEGTTYADVVLGDTETMLRQIYGIELKAEEMGVTLSDEEQAEIDASIAEFAVSMCGEGATEEELNETLKAIHVSPELFRRILGSNKLLTNCFEAKYGEQGSDISDEQALAYIEEQGVMHANHILFLTMDMSTGMSYEEDVIEEKLAAATAAMEELRAIEDDAEREAAFVAMKEERCEDTGKVLNPLGYCFVPGTMVPEFEETAAALAPYEISEPVKTSYGYHVLMGLPANPDTSIRGVDGDMGSARMLCANDLFTEEMLAAFDALELKYAEGFEKPDLASFAG